MSRFLRIYDLHYKHFVHFSELAGASCQLNSIPARDQQTALSLLAELAVQRGTLSAVLDVIRLLLSLWYACQNDRDNRLNAGLTQAPLIPLLHRFQLMHAAIPQPSNEVMFESVFVFVVLIFLLISAVAILPFNTRCLNG